MNETELIDLITAQPGVEPSDVADVLAAIRQALEIALQSHSVTEVAGLGTIEPARDLDPDVRTELVELRTVSTRSYLWTTTTSFMKNILLSGEPVDLGGVTLIPEVTPRRRGFIKYGSRNARRPGQLFDATTDKVVVRLSSGAYSRRTDLTHIMGAIELSALKCSCGRPSTSGACEHP